MNPHELAIQAQVARVTWDTFAFLLVAVPLLRVAWLLQARRYWAGRRSTFRQEVRQHASRQLKTIRGETI